MGNVVGAIHRSRDGNLWFGTDSFNFADGFGVSRYDGVKLDNFTMEDGLASNKVASITSSPDGDIWFALWGGGVCWYDGEEFTNLTSHDNLYLLCQTIRTRFSI